MRCCVIVAAALALSLFVASAAAGGTTICETYSNALFGNYTAQGQQALMSAIIDAVVGNVVANPILLPYFNGVEGPTDFLTNAAALATLKSSLAVFFGEAIGCSTLTYAGPDMQSVHSSMTIEKRPYEEFNVVVLDTLNDLGVSEADVYTIATVLDQFRDGNGVATNAVCNQADCVTSPYRVYVGSEIGQQTVTFVPPYYTIPENFAVEFVNRLTQTATLSEADGQGSCTAAASPALDDTVAVDATASFYLPYAGIASGSNFDAFVTNGSDCGSLRLVVEGVQFTICEKYSDALFFNYTGDAQEALLIAIIDAVVANVVADSITGPFFTGVASVPVLKQHLVEFFGIALGCTAPDFPAYTGNTDMTAVHTGLNIGRAAFDQFNIIVLGTANGLGVVPADLYAIADVLDDFRNVAAGASATNVICQLADCYTTSHIVYAGYNKYGAQAQNVFNPPYLTLPRNGQITIRWGGGGTHTFTAATAEQGCTTLAGAGAVSLTGFVNNSADQTYTVPMSALDNTELYFKCNTGSHCTNGMYATIRVLGQLSGTSSTTGVSSTTGTITTTGGVVTTGATTGAPPTPSTTPTISASSSVAPSPSSAGATCPLSNGVREAPTDCITISSASADTYCGWCRDTVANEYTFFDCDGDAFCNSDTVCENYVRRIRRESCDDDIGYNQCEDNTYEIACVPVSGSDVCGGFNVLSAGQACSTTADDLSNNNGCITPSVCEANVCKFTADGSTPTADAPCLPNSYLEGTTCTARIAFGGTCSPVTRNCAQNAECVTTGGVSTCVEVYSLLADGACGGFDNVCQDDLVCNDNDVCATLPNHKLDGCTPSNVDTFCGDDEDYDCICNYGRGAYACYALYNRFGSEYRRWAQCLVTNNCNLDEMFYYGSCGAVNCMGDYNSLRAAQAAAAQDLADAFSSGAALLASVALVLLAAVFAL